MARWDSELREDIIRDIREGRLISIDIDIRERRKTLTVEVLMKHDCGHIKGKRWGE